MINRDKVRGVQDRIKAAIRLIEQEEQVKISFGTCSFDNSQYGVKMTVKTTAQDESTVKAVDSVNTRMSRSYGFSENVIGKTFVGNKTGDIHTITEFKTRNRKYPIISTCNGRGYKHTPTQITNYLR
jgi:hypothetical protein